MFCFLNFGRLFIIIGSFLANRSPWLHFQQVKRYIRLFFFSQEKQISFLSFNPLKVDAAPGHTKLQCRSFPDNLSDSIRNNNPILFVLKGILIFQRRIDCVNLRVLFLHFPDFRSRISPAKFFDHFMMACNDIFGLKENFLLRIQSQSLRHIQIVAPGRNQFFGCT